ncbi:MAG: type II toxin-antitoxin system prevent-host-death family antitoxin [Pseudomonadota bacterium]
MTAINMLEAKTNLSRLVDAIERGAEREIVIARNGKPVARLVPVADSPVEQRIGIARGLFEVPDDIDTHNAEVAGLFLAGAAR